MAEEGEDPPPVDSSERAERFALSTFAVGVLATLPRAERMGCAESMEGSSGGGAAPLEGTAASQLEPEGTDEASSPSAPT